MRTNDSIAQARRDAVSDTQRWRTDGDERGDWGRGQRQHRGAARALRAMRQGMALDRCVAGRLCRGTVDGLCDRAEIVEPGTGYGDRVGRKRRRDLHHEREDRNQAGTA